MGALVRVLRDDWKKSFELGSNIITVFYNLSIYTNFHQFLAHHKVCTIDFLSYTWRHIIFIKEFSFFENFHLQ